MPWKFNPFTRKFDYYSGGWELIEKKEIETNQDYVEFTGLNGDKDKIYLLEVYIKNNGTVTNALNIWVNGNYFSTKTAYHSIYFDGTTESCMIDHATSNNGFDVGYCQKGSYEFVRILLFAESGKPRVARRCDTRLNAGVSYVEVVDDGACWWFDTTTVIYSLRILIGKWDIGGDVTSNGIGAGSRFWLFKIIE
jgi:hypothetical protein